MARLDETGELQPAREEFFHPGFEALRAEAAAEANAKAAAERAARIAAEANAKAAEAAAERAAAETTARVTAEVTARRRELLQLQTERKFGAETAERLGTLLATIDDPGQLRTVALWIIDCEFGHDLLKQVRALGPGAKPT